MAEKPSYTGVKGTRIYATKPNIPALNDEALGDVSNLISNWNLNLSNIEMFISNMQTNFSKEEVKRNIFVKAFNLTIQDLGKQIRPMMAQVIRYAAIQTREFNYPPYLSTLERAVAAHWNDCIAMTFKNNGIHTLAIDMSPFGDISEWGFAVQDTRDTYGWGKIPEPRRSAIWKEKIYGVDREGVRITKKKANKKGKTTTRDITEKYMGAYGFTVIDRLSRIRQNTAPFIDLIRFGNVSLGASDRGGEPYPSFPGFDFVPILKERIITAFDLLFKKYVNNITRQYDAFLSRLGLSASAKNLPEEVARRAEILVGQIDKPEIAREMGQKSFERIRIEGGEIQLYLSKNLRLAARRYNIDESGFHKQISYKYSMEGK